MKLSELGEAGLIDLIRNWTGGPSRKVVVGPGDDAAVLEPTGGRQLVVSTDAYREGVHFTCDYLDADQIGQRVMAGTLSDLAAMGAEGLAAFVNLHAPPETPVDFLRAVYLGMDRIADACGVVIAGGDTVRGDLAFGVTVIGTVAEGEAVLRDGAREGDVLCVSGELGRSEAGRILLTEELDVTIPRALRTEAEGGHRAPRPRFDVSRLLMSLERRALDVDLEEETVERIRPTAMIDVSDGLALDLRRLCEASHVGCRLEERRIPVDGAARRIARARGKSEIDLALGGGEDFELLFTMDPAGVEILLDATHAARLSVSPVGTIVPSREGLLLVGEEGEEGPLPEAGYDHFTQAPPGRPAGRRPRRRKRSA